MKGYERKFGNRIYLWSGFEKTKAAAKNYAAKMRKKWDYVRVVPGTFHSTGKKGYNIFIS